jgi:hypothetical protein
MEQLITQVAQQTGITDEQARETVRIVVHHLRDRLPPSNAAQIDMYDSATQDDSAAQSTVRRWLFGKS